MSNWKSMETAPTGWHNYFLVRVKGINPNRGEKYVPAVVQQVQGDFYFSENELDPIEFGQNMEHIQPFPGLEWLPLPE